MTVFNLTSGTAQNNNRVFASITDAENAATSFSKLALNEQVGLIKQVSLKQATHILLQTPLKNVQHILEQLNNTGEELRARELNAQFGLIISQGQPTRDYFQASVMEHVRSRIGWIVSLSLFGILSGMIIARYEDALSALVILAIYMPVMADTGGNCGSQAATLLVRSLAIGEVSIRDWSKVLWTEFRVALIMAAVLMLVIMIRVVGFGSDVNLPAGISLTQVGMAVSIAMAIQVVSSTVLGSMLPILARSLKLDPAILVSPVLTSIVDMTGLLIYFYTTSQILGL